MIIVRFKRLSVHYLIDFWCFFAFLWCSCLCFVSTAERNVFSFRLQCVFKMLKASLRSAEVPGKGTSVQVNQQNHTFVSVLQSNIWSSPAQSHGKVYFRPADQLWLTLTWLKKYMHVWRCSTSRGRYWLTQKDEPSIRRAESSQTDVESTLFA